jgi:SWI/SNF related-matrix-associated actin-dependent regulator of chromatin subfamily C
MENPTYSSIADRDAPWDDAETLRLLEALERYDEDWAEVADYVGTRTKEECVVNSKLLTNTSMLSQTGVQASVC